MIELGELPPPTLAIEHRVALAWALKDECYAAWSSEPSRAARAADALRHLCGSNDTGNESPAHKGEMDALAEWTAGIAALTRGEMAEAALCFDRAAAAFHAIGKDHHATETQVPKIMALSLLGQHGPAVECALQAQREFVAQRDVRAAGKVSLNLGNLYVRQDKFPQAAKQYREATVLFARVGDREHSVMADIGMADALTSMGDFDEALRIYARARQRAHTHGFPVLEAMVEESVALLELARGHFREALAGFEASRRGYELLGMPQNLAVAEKQLADAYLELNLLPEALALFDAVLVKFETQDMPDDEAWTLSQRGRAQMRMGNVPLASGSLGRAAALFRQQGNGVGEAAVALTRAEVLLAGDDPDAALALAQLAATGFAAADLPDRRARADVVCAQSLLRAGRLAEARALFDATLATARHQQLLPVEVRCLIGQGLAARAGGDAATAHQAFTAAVALFEDLRRALPGDEIRSAFLSDHLRAYQELLRLALEVHARDASPAQAALVLQHLDRFRARALGERLEQRGGGGDDAGTQDLRERLNWLYRRVRRLQDEAQPAATLTAELRSTEHELLERARRQRLAAPPSDRAVLPGDDFRADDLRDLLHDGDALVEYGVVDDELFACVVTRGGVTLQRQVAGWAEVQDAVQSVRFQIETLRHGTAPVAQHLESLTRRVQARLRRLHDLVWAPLAASLAPSRRVLVVPHAELGSLPFAALHDGRQSLGERHALALAPSARVALRGLRAQPVPARQALVLGESTRLPNAAAEARFVASLFARSDVFVGADATLSTLRAHAGGADVIHLACHAQFRSDNPMFSALHLHDGALTVESAEALHLKPCIVVLSACETGLSEHDNGEETVGLVRAFLIGGAARVVASLWPVDDEVTAAFMAHFYGGLGRGEGPAAALAGAQDAMRQTHPHPYFWGAFALYGGW